MLKVVPNEKWRASGRWHMIGIGLMLLWMFFLFYSLAATVEKTYSVSALSSKLMGKVLTNTQCATNIILPFIMHQYISDTNSLASLWLLVLNVYISSPIDATCNVPTRPIYWCGKHFIHSVCSCFPVIPTFKSFQLSDCSCFLDSAFSVISVVLGLSNIYSILVPLTVCSTLNIQYDMAYLLCCNMRKRKYFFFKMTAIL